MRSNAGVVRGIAHSTSLLGGRCSAMCLAGREHSPTVKQKEPTQQQQQPLPMARVTKRSGLPFPLCGLAAHGSSTPTGGLKKDTRPGRKIVVETCEDLGARRARVGLVYGNVAAVRWVVRPMLDERLQHLGYNSRSSTGACSALPDGNVTM